MIDIRKVVVSVIMFVFVLIAAGVLLDGAHYVRQNEFCQICHEKEFESYSAPGESLDFAHSRYEVSCAGCHEGHDHTAFTFSMAKMIFLDVTGGSSPPRSKEEVIIENKERCEVCHNNLINPPGRLNPHFNVTDCSTCHSGHTRGMEEETCAKCHPVPQTTLELEGGKHSKKGCDFCHPSHGYIMECQQCHGSFHRGIFVDCYECHTDAHKPQEIVFTDLVLNRSLCLNCHEDVSVTFTVHQSKHANLDCIMCHPSHGQKQQCSQCHRPHGEKSTQADCFICHSGHMPRDVVYSINTPKALCLECHEQAGNTILNSTNKHSTIGCVKCHPNHGQVPSCMDCHGTPHTTTTTDCERCHISAHDLWIKE